MADHGGLCICWAVSVYWPRVMYWEKGAIEFRELENPACACGVGRIFFIIPSETPAPIGGYLRLFQMKEYLHLKARSPAKPDISLRRPLSFPKEQRHGPYACQPHYRIDRTA